MRLSLSSLSLHKNSFDFNKNMSPRSIYAIELPYLGAILLGKSPLNLTSFQKPLLELYLPYYKEHIHDERRIVISDNDILIFEPDKSIKNKSTYIYSNFQSIVDVQILKLSIRYNNTETQVYKRMQTAFLPIGCEQQERFRSVYSTINKSQYNILSTSTSYHPTLLLFIIRKPGSGHSSSLLDCHVFVVYREILAFELCEMIRKLIIKRTMSPILTKKLSIEQNQNDTSRNPLSSPSLQINHVQHSSSPPPPPILSYHDTSKVLTMNSDIHSMSSKQRHFIKASTLIHDESDEILNDLMNIVATEKLKSQGSIKRHASFDQTTYSDDNIMNKKRYFHTKKRLLNPNNNPTQQQKVHSMIEGHLLRPQIVINRYGDIGNYVPKFLRENITMRSSDSNENIFFRSTNAFIKLDFLSNKKSSNENHYYQSTPCLNQDQNIYSLVKQLQKNHSSIEINDNDQKIQPTSKPKRIASFTIADTELPIDYRQYLRHTDQGAYLYGEEQRQQTTLEHSLGYLP